MHDLIRDWLDAEKQLKYRINRRIYDLISKEDYENLQSAKAIADQEFKPEIEKRAYATYCARRDYMLDNWLEAENDFYCDPAFIIYFDDYINFIKKTDPSLGPAAARQLARSRVLDKRAYYIWENRNNRERDWYLSEASYSDEIEKLAKIIQKECSHLNLNYDECRYYARDKYYEKIQVKAYYSRKWISEYAYYLSRNRPSNSAFDNWILAEKDYSKIRSE